MIDTGGQVLLGIIMQFGKNFSVIDLQGFHELTFVTKQFLFFQLLHSMFNAKKSFKYDKWVWTLHSVTTAYICPFHPCRRQTPPATDNRRVLRPQATSSHFNRPSKYLHFRSHTNRFMAFMRHTIYSNGLGLPQCSQSVHSGWVQK